MKGIGVLVLIALIGSSAYNYWQVEQLRSEVASLKTQLEGRRSESLAEDIMARAAIAILQAREAVSGSDLQSAKEAVQSAQAYLAQARKAAGDHAGPRLKWLSDQANGLGRQVQERLGR